MKNTKKILIASAILVVSSISGVSAMDMNSGINKAKEMREKVKQERQGFRADMKKSVEERKEFVKKNRKAIKENIKTFREGTKKELRETFKTLDTETKKALKEERKNLLEQIKKIREEIKANKTNFEKVVELRKQIDTLRKENFEKIKEKLKDNPKAQEAIEKRIALFEKNAELRKANLEKRIAFRGARADKILKYKEIFIKRLGDRINKIPTKRLEKIVPKIDKFLERIEKNKRISQEKKDKLISQLTALKEIIDEKLENIQTEDVETDIEALLN